MDFYERLSMRPILWARLHDLTGNSFQDFFQDLMTACLAGFIDVRTHGNLGDLASDGLSLHDGKLYACYAPETPDATRTIAKFRTDLVSAVAKRAGQFATFVFVHNDVRGTHPEVAAALATAQSEYPDLQFEILGMRHIRDMLGDLDRRRAEALLGVPLPLQHTASVGLQEMEEILEQLASARGSAIDVAAIEEVSVYKLRFSELTPDSQAELREGMRHSATIDDYYSQRIDVTERDEVASRFRSEYQEAVAAGLGPEEVLLRLREFLAGSRLQAGPNYRAQTAVLSYFFQSCDIYENPPTGWNPPVEEAS